MSEAKVFESNGFVVTSERFVHGSKVVRFSELEKHAIPFIDKGWSGSFIIAGIGLAMLAWGGTLWKVIGFLLLPGAVAFFRYTISRTLLLCMKSGEIIRINVETTELLNSLVSAINNAAIKLQASQEASRRDALRTELDELPTA